MDACVESGGVGVELHGIGFNAHDGSGVGGEQDMGDLSEHRVGEILDHECHAVGLGVAEA